MLISYNWLKEYFEKLPDPKKLGEILNVKSFEVESIDAVDDDFVLNIDVLPNRSHDCLCHSGVAREIATVVEGVNFIEKRAGKIFADSVRGVKQEITKLKGATIQVEVKTDFCRRYVAREIKNIQIRESPIEIKNKLKSLGQKSINNIVDISNIVMFEMGQPMHAFDSDKLSGNKIIIRPAENGEKIFTLDKQEINLSENDHVIADEKNILAVAGVKGGKIAEVDINTKNLILESANFVPSLVRKTAKKIGIGTESSKRFENEITPEICVEAIDLVTELIIKYASTDQTEVYEYVDHYPQKWLQYKTGVSLSEIEKVLGLKISNTDVEKSLKLLNFEYEIIDVRSFIVNEAKKHLGKPYKYGASVRRDAPNLFDCSSFSAYIYFLAGIPIPRISIEQSIFGVEITEEELLPGDLVFCNTGDAKNKIHFETVEFLPGTKVESGIDHVGIYIGNGEVIHSSSHNKNGIEIHKLQNHSDFSKNTKFGRIINDKDRFVVKIPKYRLDIGSNSGIDIKSTVELIEEIGRVHGYEHIDDQPINNSGFVAKINKVYAYNNIIRKVLTDAGFSEVITYSFTSAGEISPEKPISEDKNFLRTEISTGIKDSLEKNIKNADLLGVDTIKIFEIGKVFKNNSENLNLAIGVINRAGFKKPKASEVIMGAVDILSKQFDGKIKINPKTDQSILEINLDEIYDNSSINIPEKYIDIGNSPENKYKPISAYPFILRDIAVWLPNSINSEKLLNIIKEKSGELLVNFRLFDEYKKEDKTSYAYRLVFQSHKKTMTDAEINIIMQNINDAIQNEGWEVR